MPTPCCARADDNNPSAGNRAGGSSNLTEVYEYAQPVKARQVAGGANLICFTTGRGSAYGCAPSPSLKLATNSALMQRQSDDMDSNCGEVLDGRTSSCLGRSA
jgi:altronate hydrolase